MKKILNFFSVIVIMFTLVAITGCNRSKIKKETTIMNISCNPSVEFVLDKENKVISVSALNEDGNVILIGETFIGKTAKEAAELFIKIAEETGFIAKGEVTEGQNNIEIAISGDSKKANKLYNNVKDKINSYLSSSNIVANIEDIQTLTLDNIKTLVKENYSSFTDEQMNELTQEELINYLKDARNQTSELYSQGLKEAFVTMKDYEISFAENQKILELLQEGGVIYQLISSSYLEALTRIEEAKQTLENARYNYLIKEDSLYQTKLKNLNTAKDELIKLRNNIANMEDGSAKEIAKEELTTLETNYNIALNAYNNAYTTINTAINTSTASIETAQHSLKLFMETLTSQINTLLDTKKQEIDQVINNAKENAYANFEELYSSQIENTKNEILARKESLKQAISNN